MATISLYSVPAFDADFDQSISFLYSGNQSVKNRLTIYDSQSNKIVYDQEEVTFKLVHMIPAKTLSNGTNYNCTITAYDILGNGITSNKIDLICITTPVWVFDNLYSSQIIRNSGYSLNLIYQQNEGELLNEFVVFLYDSSMKELWSSETLYDSDNPVNISGLADNSKYYVRAIGKTVNGFSIDTLYVPFSVEYITPLLYSVMHLENKELEGLVKITSNIVIIVGKAFPENSPYINDEMIDLRKEGSYVLFDNGFSLKDNFLIMLNGYGFSHSQTFLTLGYNDQVTLTWHSIPEIENGQTIVYSFVELKVHNRSCSYVIYSNRIPEPLSNEQINIWIRRIDGLYEVIINNKGVV